MPDFLKTHRDIPVNVVMDTRFNSDKRVTTMLRLETVSSTAQKLLIKKKVNSIEEAIEQAKIIMKATR